MNVMILRRAQRGAALVEALIAFLVLGIGMVGLLRAQPELRLHAEQARQRAEAVRIAQSEIEGLRAGSDPAALGDETRTVAPDAGWAATASFTVERSVGTSAWPRTRPIVVRVIWNDARGQPQQLTIASLVAAEDASLGAVAMLRR